MNWLYPNNVERIPRAHRDDAPLQILVVTAKPLGCPPRSIRFVSSDGRTPLASGQYVQEKIREFCGSVAFLKPTRFSHARVSGPHAATPRHRQISRSHDDGFYRPTSWIRPAWSRHLGAHPGARGRRCRRHSSRPRADRKARSLLTIPPVMRSPVGAGAPDPPRRISMRSAVGQMTAVGQRDAARVGSRRKDAVHATANTTGWRARRWTLNLRPDAHHRAFRMPCMLRRENRVPVPYVKSPPSLTWCQQCGTFARPSLSFCTTVTVRAVTKGLADELVAFTQALMRPLARRGADKFLGSWTP